MMKSVIKEFSFGHHHHRHQYLFEREGHKSKCTEPSALPSRMLNV